MEHVSRLIGRLRAVRRRTGCGTVVFGRRIEINAHNLIAFIFERNMPPIAVVGSIVVVALAVIYRICIPNPR